MGQLYWNNKNYKNISQIRLLVNILINKYGKLVRYNIYIHVHVTYIHIN